MMRRNIRLKTDLDFLDALNSRARLTVTQGGEYIGIGEFVDWDKSKAIVTIFEDDGTVGHFVKQKCEFFREIGRPPHH
ncbi:hypothetical protein MO973_25310 [Paenibacillus sp. TRM 82003]|nr:hypothetical protein [Paenibacillus sp. TRM 82003]